MRAELIDVSFVILGIIVLISMVALIGFAALIAVLVAPGLTTRRTVIRSRH